MEGLGRERLRKSNTFLQLIDGTEQNFAFNKTLKVVFLFTIKLATLKFLVAFQICKKRKQVSSQMEK